MSSSSEDDAESLLGSSLGRSLIEVLERQSRLLEKQTACLEALQRNVSKDESSGSEAPWHAESTWGAIFETAVSRTREMTEEWKGFMDVSLVFSAIFLAVVTAFLVPANQSLSTTSTDATNTSAANPSNATLDCANATSPSPPAPSRPMQMVSALYSSAFTVSILNSALCLLARQWVSKLVSIPSGKTNLERTMRHEDRKKMSERWLPPLVYILYGTLLCSIGLFVYGFLLQQRLLSESFDGPAPVLTLAEDFAIVLSVSVLLLVLATIAHALCSVNGVQGIASLSLLKLERFCSVQKQKKPEKKPS
ncbi:hypothetical protein SISNIDRAFT_163072 [Sistotremastrum niveocremeum HHB9708]|uniref:DUF6535 domain-containing protein n=1 Tax=Sistotremastrum niveocremeum HHB9708 TaxID=1314777 RepID=A0A164SP46_9AGAM|nr:hypothetical protein SISNIDRAFT_163072 [Sistotremastrum niveocremeum HHB9708]